MPLPDLVIAFRAPDDVTSVVFNVREDTGVVNDVFGEVDITKEGEVPQLKEKNDSIIIKSMTAVMLLKIPFLFTGASFITIASFESNTHFNLIKFGGYHHVINADFADDPYKRLKVQLLFAILSAKIFAKVLYIKHGLEVGGNFSV
jgi:hypothetical protein